jgi:hypothetical protein
MLIDAAIPLASSDVPGCSWTTDWLTAGPVLLGDGVADADVAVAAADGAVVDGITLTDDPIAASVPAAGDDVHPVRPATIKSAAVDNAAVNLTGRASILTTPSR